MAVNLKKLGGNWGTYEIEGCLLTFASVEASAVVLEKPEGGEQLRFWNHGAPLRKSGRLTTALQER